MRMLIIVMLVVILIPNLSGCGPMSEPLYINEEIEARNMADKLINAIDNRERDALKGLFSNKVIGKALDLDVGIDYLLSLYSGSLVQYEYHGSNASFGYGTASDGSSNREIYVASYCDIKTTDKEYRLFFEVSVLDIYDPSTEGLTFLKLTEKSAVEGMPEERLDNRWYSGDYEARIGIFNPQWDEDQDKIEAISQKIFDALEAKDKGALRALFSERVQNEVSDLDEGLDYVMKQYQGQYIDAYSSGSRIEKTNTDGGYLEVIYGRGRIDFLDDPSCDVIFEYNQANESDPQSIGLTFLKVANSSIIDKKNYEQNNRAHYERDGIYHPGWDSVVDE